MTYAVGDKVLIEEEYSHKIAVGTITFVEIMPHNNYCYGYQIKTPWYSNQFFFASREIICKMEDLTKLEKIIYET